MNLARIYLLLIVSIWIPGVVMADLKKPVEQDDSYFAETRYRTSLSEAEACSDFKVIEKNEYGQVVEKSIAEASIIPERVFEKEKNAELATVNLVVNEKPTRSLFSLLQQLGRLNKSQFARAGTVYVVSDKNPFQFLSVYTSRELKDTLLSLSESNTGFSLKPVMQAPKQYNISHSPTWIVEHRGKTHIFEGNYSINSLFTANGTFKGDENQ